MKSEIPEGVSRVNILLSLARLATNLGAFKLAREIYQRLHSLRIPKHLSDEVDLASVSINGKPVSNRDDLVPICYRCSLANPFLLQNGDQCAHCHHPFVRCMATFEILPLVEFELESSLKLEDAMKLLDTITAPIKGKQGGEGTDGLDINDPFSKALVNADTSQAYKPIQVTAQMIKSFRKQDVYACTWPTSLVRTRLYRNIYPKTRISHCTTCNQFFHADKYEFEKLKNDCCLFCKTKTVITEQQ